MRQFYFLALSIICFGAAGFAQASDQDAPRPKSEAPYFQHRFFDLMNDSAIGAAAVPIIGDSLSTQRFLGTGRIKEANPIARPFVNNVAGQAFISTVGFGSTMGGMYLFHRLEGIAGERHRKTRIMFSFLERMTPLVVSGVEFDRWRHNDLLIKEIRQACAASNAVCK
jgi:hypothetical protein